jgi:hypothetical protein
MMAAIDVSTMDLRWAATKRLQSAARIAATTACAKRVVAAELLIFSLHYLPPSVFVKYIC